MTEVPIIGEVIATERRADDSDWLEIRLFPEGMTALNADRKIVKVVSFERRERIVSDIIAANQGQLHYCDHTFEECKKLRGTEACFVYERT